MSRRELADLFGVGGKKPARIIKYIEEDGFYSMQAYPAGLVAVLAGRSPEAGPAAANCGRSGGRSSTAATARRCASTCAWHARPTASS